MQKSQFSGITILEAGESLIDDDGAYTGHDRKVIDFFLERGAKTHRHTGATGLTNPTIAPGAANVASGGTIPADVDLVVGYTLQDDARGETTLSPTTVVSTPAPLTPPESEIIATLDYGTGVLTVDSYYYAITHIDDEGGETPLGPSVIAQRQPGYPNARVLLSGLDDDFAESGAVGWRLYRARSGGQFAFLASGTSDAYTDDGTVSPVCDTLPPNDDFNSTNNINSLVLTLPAASGIDADTAFINVYVSDSGTFSGSTFLEQFPVASAGAEVVYREILLLPDSPPSVSTSVGDPAKIDPDTEIEDWHWKRPVADSGVLPSGEEGDARVTLDDGVIYVYSGGDWIAAAGGGGGSGTVKDVRDGTTTATNVESILFTAGAGVGVAVADNGAEAEVTITASGGGGGSGFEASGGVEGVDLTGITKLTIGMEGYDAANETGIMPLLASGAAGEARVTLYGEQHITHWADCDTLAGVASGAQASGSFSTVGGNAADLLKIRTNKRCRVRLYGDTASRAADASRPIGTDPGPNAGVILDYFLDEGGGGTHILSPVVAAYVMTEPPDGIFYFTVNSHDSTGDVEVSFYVRQTWVPVA